MAGKIIADQIEHSTAGSLDTQYVVNGSAKAWFNANCNATTYVNRDSFNISSILEASSGDFRESYTSNMDITKHRCLRY